jgi:hypothetical protein
LLRNGDPESEPEVPAFAIPEGVLAREVEGEMVLLNLRSEQYYGLDRIGTDIVGRLTRLAEDNAVAELCQDYDVAAEVLQADIARLVHELMEAGLLERKSPH